MATFLMTLDDLNPGFKGNAIIPRLISLISLIPFFLLLLKTKRPSTLTGRNVRYLIYWLVFVFPLEKKTDVGFYLLFMVMQNVYVVDTVSKFIKCDLILILFRKCVFWNRVIDRWNSLDHDTVDANCFKSKLNKVRSTQMGFFVDWSAKLELLSRGFTSRLGQGKHNSYL